MDGDLREFSPDFVSGIVGPLLTEPDVQFVKAMYDRPLARPPGQGGRVTELVARPLLNLHWPQLAGFVQPLGGEYAARRSLLERLPVPRRVRGGAGPARRRAAHWWGWTRWARSTSGCASTATRTTRRSAGWRPRSTGRLNSACPGAAGAAGADPVRAREEGFEPRTHAVDTEERPPMREIAEYAARRAA